jgi:hypothetical protein
LLVKACCHASPVRAAKPPPGAAAPPTVWTSMSTPPRRSRTKWTAASAPSAVLRSAATNRPGWSRSWGWRERRWPPWRPHL